jgi:hypothetical protein
MTTTKAAVFIAASMSNCGETVALSANAPMAIIAPSIFAPKDKGFPFNSIHASEKMATEKGQEQTFLRAGSCTNEIIQNVVCQNKM